MAIKRSLHVAAIGPEFLDANISLGALGLAAHILAGPEGGVEIDDLAARYPEDDLPGLAEELVEAGLLLAGPDPNEGRRQQEVDRRFHFSGYVYVIADKDHCKIGITGKVSRRLATLQASNAEKLFLVFAERVDDCWSVEQAAHKSLARKRKRGEWFACTPGEAVAAVKSAIETPKKQR